MNILKRITFGFLFIAPFIMTMATSLVWQYEYFFNGMTEYNFYPFGAYATGTPVIDWVTEGGWQLVAINILVMALSFYIFTKPDNFMTTYWKHCVEAMTTKQLLAMTISSTVACLLLNTFFLTRSLTGVLIGATFAIGMYKGGLR